MKQGTSFASTSTSSSTTPYRFERQRGLIPDTLFNILPESAVFIPGLGAIGSAALLALARTGIGRFVIIDPDTIGLENIASQVFATQDTLGLSKTDAACRAILAINPNAVVEIRQRTNDISELSSIITSVDVVVLGMDTLGGGIACYRAARLVNRPVVDFLYFPTPNVISTLPNEATPEERFEYPTRWLNPDACETWSVAAESLLRVVTYGFAANPGLLGSIGAELQPALRRFLRLEGSIPSFAPLTIEVGALMARETLAMLAWRHRIEWPRLGQPAFYVDTLRGLGGKPSSALLRELPDAEQTMTILREVRDDSAPH